MSPSVYQLQAVPAVVKQFKEVSESAVDEAANSVKDWLGDEYQTVTNKSGDNIFMSKNGTKKNRLDLKNTHGDNPHVHLEEFRNGKWKDAISGTHRIYPK